MTADRRSDVESVAMNPRCAVILVLTILAPVGLAACPAPQPTHGPFLAPISGPPASPPPVGDSRPIEVKIDVRRLELQVITLDLGSLIEARLVERKQRGPG